MVETSARAVSGSFFFFSWGWGGLAPESGISETVHATGDQKRRRRRGEARGGVRKMEKRLRGNILQDS